MANTPLPILNTLHATLGSAAMLLYSLPVGREPDVEGKLLNVMVGCADLLEAVEAARSALGATNPTF